MRFRIYRGFFLKGPYEDSALFNGVLPGARSCMSKTQLDEDIALKNRRPRGRTAQQDKKALDFNTGLGAHYARPLPNPTLSDTIFAYLVGVFLSAKLGTFASPKLGPDKRYPLTGACTLRTVSQK